MDAPRPAKDETAEHEIAASWRPTLRAIVRAFTRDDFQLAEGVPGVQSVSPENAKQMREYVADYGGTLIELPEDTWKTSRAQWLGHGWHVLVDLWTREEGRSDMVLDLEVVESDDGYRFRIHLVYVP